MYEVEDKGNRGVSYAKKSVIEEEILKQYCITENNEYMEQLTDITLDSEIILPDTDYLDEGYINKKKPKKKAKTGGSEITESNLSPIDFKEAIIAKEEV